MVKMDGPWPTFQIQTVPIPKLEGKNIGRCADFQNHAVLSRTMNGSRRNQEVIVLLCRPPIHKALRREWAISALRTFERLYHLFRLDSLSHSQEHSGIFYGVQQVVALVLRIIHAELILDVLRQRVNLQR